MNMSLQHSAWCFRLLLKSKTFFSIGIVLATGCTATQVRWDATNIRKQVMVYYNDQIMENLIRAKNHLPFVHVDITLLTSQGSSQISGTIGAGEAVTHNDSGPSGVLNNVARTVTRPFAYSVTPQQTETLSIQSAPALGSQAQWSPLPTETGSPRWQETKKTYNVETAGNQTGPTTIESTLAAPSSPKPITIYDLYERFAQSPHLAVSPTQPKKPTYLPGTLKQWDDGQYYYIRNDEDDKDAYYKFCRKLFTKGQAASLEKKLTEIQAAAALR